MKIEDSFNKKQREIITQDSIEPFQQVLDSNLLPNFSKDMNDLIDRYIKHIGCCVLIPGNNCPFICREGVERIMNVREDLDEFCFPAVHNAFGKKPNPGDPLIFMLLSNTAAGLKMEWEHLWETWRGGRIVLPQTDSDDMRLIDRAIRKQLKEIREREKNDV